METKIKKYVEKCFVDAFRSENKEYTKDAYSFAYVLVKNSEGIFQMYPIIRCKYDRILRKVEYRLKNNLMKNFGIEYQNTEDMRCDFNEDGRIDANFTQAMFKEGHHVFAFQIIDKNTKPYENDKKGKCMVAYTYEKLVFQYWHINAKIYNQLSESDERNHLPKKLLTDWDAFKKLYKETFDKELGSDYEIICSKELTRL